MLKLEEAKTAKDEKVSKILSPGETATNWLAFQNNPSPLGGVPRGTGTGVRGAAMGKALAKAKLLPSRC